MENELITPPSIFRYAQRITAELRQERRDSDRLLLMLLEQDTIITDLEKQIELLKTERVK